MDIAQFIANFIYRIRYWLLWGTLIITGIVIYFTQFLPFSYTVEGSLYAGVTNSTSLDGSSANLISINRYPIYPSKKLPSTIAANAQRSTNFS